MFWIPVVLAGTSLLALPHPLKATDSIRSPSTLASASFPTQISQAQGQLPASLYARLRTQTLAHASLIAGPRLKNPNVGPGGLDRHMAAALAEQRAYHPNLSMPSSSASVTSLLSGRTATLLPSPTLIQPEQKAGSEIGRHMPSFKSSCSWPAIRAVNGRSTPVFTPVEPDNHYRITGCAFGSTPGNVRLQPSSTAAALSLVLQPISFQLDTLRSWTDDHIDVHINPGLSGVPDFDADLIIQLPNGRSVQLAHCQFLAARGESRLLSSIPAAWVRLDATSLSAHAIHQIEYESPIVVGEETPLDAAGSSAFVVRSDPQAFATGRDSYDLSQLAPGWVIESVQLRVFNSVCPGENKPPVSNGSWETTWTPHGFVIAWADETCTSTIPPVFDFTLSSSQYAADVWVVGPAGTQPLPSNISARQP